MITSVTRAADGGAGTAAARPWPAVLAEAIRDPAELCRLLGLPAALAAAAREASRGFSLLAPRPYLARIRPGDPRDPLLLQILPQGEELCEAPGFTADPLREQTPVREGAPVGEGNPVEETTFIRGPGLLAKYQGRLLIVASGACAVHCRFCFRRHFDYCQRAAVGPACRAGPEIASGTGHPLAGRVPMPRRHTECAGYVTVGPACPGGTLAEGQREVPPGRRDLRLSAAAIAVQRVESDPTIEEIILSGGDPLMLSDAVLARFARRLAAVPHVRRLRIHTRLPIVVPQRVTDELVGWLRGTRLTPIVVVHCNHPAEIDGHVAAALGRLVDAGVVVLNQAVLLRGVNDRADVLAELCGRLVDLRVMPYYLHQLDRVAGTAHFEVAESRAALVAQLRARLPGYAVPRYVRKIPGEKSKRLLPV